MYLLECQGMSHTRRYQELVWHSVCEAHYDVREWPMTRMQALIKYLVLGGVRQTTDTLLVSQIMRKPLGVAGIPCKSQADAWD